MTAPLVCPCRRHCDRAGQLTNLSSTESGKLLNGEARTVFYKIISIYINNFVITLILYATVFTCFYYKNYLHSAVVR